MRLKNVYGRVPGATFTVSLDGMPITVEEDGYLGEWTEQAFEGSKFTISATVEPFVFALSVDGQKNVTPKAAFELLASQRVYTATIAVHWNPQYKCCITRHPANYFALVVVNSAGQFSFYEVAIVSQLGKFFLTTQWKYVAQLFNNEHGGIDCPQFKAWPQLVQAAISFFNKLPNIRLASLPLTSEYVPDVAEEPKKLGDNQGEVLFWDAAKGFGALRVPHGSARAFVADVAPRGRWRYLVPGEVVAYTQLASLAPRGSFLFDAKGIRPVS